MKVSAIPAQITTIEDRIAGNLSLTQIILLAVPLFLTAMIFFLFPPIGHFVIYKLVIAIILVLSSAILAIRLNDKLVIDLIKLRGSFELRPRIYVYRKQLILPKDVHEAEDLKTTKAVVAHSTISLSTTAKVNSQKLLSDSKYSVAFISKTGGLVVKVSVS